MAQHQAPGPPLDVSILDQETLDARWLHPNSEAAQFAVPGEDVAVCLPSERLDGPFLNGGQSERQAVADTIAAALETVGFFYLIGHGVPPEVRAAVFDRSADFFHLPIEERRKLKTTDDWNRGWIQTDPGKTLTAAGSSNNIASSANSHPTIPTC